MFNVGADSVAEKRYIGLCPEQENRIVVTRGLVPGELIVTEGYQKLTPGEKVTYKVSGPVTIEQNNDDSTHIAAPDVPQGDSSLIRSSNDSMTMPQTDTSKRKNR